MDDAMAGTAMVSARGGAPEGVYGAPGPPCGAGVFRRRGDFWEVAFAGRVSLVKELKGMHYIALLLRAPENTQLALDILYEANGGAVEPRITACDLGPLLDPQARRAFADRVAALDAESEEAERFNDLLRVAALRAEREAIVSQLHRAVGLGGRARVGSSPLERARLCVTKGIKAAIERIRRHHPALAVYLANHLKTGCLCAYRPDPDRPIAWQL